MNEAQMRRPPRRLEFRIAREPWELEQIHRLNYVTFTEEIPQYGPEESRRRVDKFHDQNVYVVCVADERVVGMIAVRFERPFSVETKLSGFEAYVPAGRRLCELRLLAVEKEFRGGAALAGLIGEVWKSAASRGCDAAVISATTRQLRLYEHLGFVPFGPLVGSAEAPFQPMLLTRESFARQMGGLYGVEEEEQAAGEKAVFLPGPVAIHRDVVAAFGERAFSHRSTEFAEEMSAARGALRRLTGASNAQIVTGTGTLANDMVAAQIACWEGQGLILTNGEFGERLQDHSRRFRLRFESMRFDWGEAIDLERVRRAIEARGVAWIWMTACETSTGVLNDWSRIAAIARSRSARICLDAVSAIGSVPVDLSEVDFASGVSGKGLGSYPGLAMVFHRDPAAPADGIPRSLDLGLYDANSSVPFTHSSNLLRALRVALERPDWPASFALRAELGAELRARLASMNLRLIGAGATPAPHAVTIELEPKRGSAHVGTALAARGFLVAWESSYLRTRNWLQIALMGEVTRPGMKALLRALRQVLRES
ncbi:MAG: aminotransferase class V-fold PLP-dependent enzyme [Thermoanaerobaculia bacterium]